MEHDLVQERTVVDPLSDTLVLAAKLERSIAMHEDPARALALLELLRQALHAALDESSPDGSRRIAGLLAELDHLELQLETGRIQWLGGIERQCRFLNRARVIAEGH